MKGRFIHVGTYLNDVDLVQTRELRQIPAKEHYIRDQIAGTNEVPLKFFGRIAPAIAARRNHY
jgi:hypothetical protein